MPDGKLEKIIARAADSLGDVSAVGIGFLLSAAGPEAAYIGAAAGPVVAGVAQDLASRVMSRKEEHRLGAVMIFALETMKQLQDGGSPVRNDGFWSSSNDFSSPGEEVVEAVLIAAQREPQEKKLEYLGCMLAQIAYHDEIPAETAMWMINMAERCTWTQYTLISMIGRKDQFDLSGIEVGQGIGSWKGWAVHEELKTLGEFGLGLMGAPPKKTPRMGLALFNMDLTDFELSNGGSLLYNFLGVGDIATDEIEGLIAALREEAKKDNGEQAPAK